MLLKIDEERCLHNVFLRYWKAVIPTIIGNSITMIDTIIQICIALKLGSAADRAFLCGLIESKPLPSHPYLTCVLAF